MNKRHAVFALATLFILGGCGAVEPTPEPQPQEETPAQEEIVVDNSYLDNLTSEELMMFPDLKIEVNQRLCIDNFAREIEGSKITVRDPSIAKYEGEYLVGLKVGKTYLAVEANNKCQKVNVEVFAEGTLKRAFNFSDMQKGQKIVSFGDSVTANATINADLTYVRRIADAYGLRLVNNYAIGGTTATYMFPGSNIEKEYYNLDYAIDGVRVVKKAYDNGELNNIDYAFIAYGHNDHYFQPPITADGDDQFNINSFASAYSFKGSYRYMINLLRLANPNIKIIILNCTYSEYMVDGGSYGNVYKYEDYRKAQYDIADEMDVKIVDPWNYLKTIFDGTTRKINYKDVVHLTVKGHEKLGTYLKKY